MTTDFSCVSQKEDFLLLNIKVQPGAQRNEIKGFRNDRWLLRIKGVPEKGKVNRNLFVFLSKQLAIPQAEIQLVKGSTSREKVLRLPLICREGLFKLLRETS